MKCNIHEASKKRLNGEPNGYELKYVEYPIYYDWDT